MSDWRVAALEADVGRFHLGPVDLALPPGRAVAILGRSGAGKTTLLRVLAGFVPARRGHVVRDGIDVTAWYPEERRLGYVPQGLGLFPHRTVARNVSYALDLAEAPDRATRTADLLARFGLTGLKDRYPARLSGGEAQRVALARALAADPELLVWDEPWQALDVEARADLAELLHELRTEARVPLVVVTHDPALAFSVADRFVVLRDGHVLLDRDAGGLIAAPPDAFTARFVGFENVVDDAALAAASPGPFAAFLSTVRGDDGVAFSVPVGTSAPAAPGRFEGTVRGARPTPDGVAIDLRIDGLVVHLRLPSAPGLPAPQVGERIRFDLDPAGVRALGPARGGAS